MYSVTAVLSIFFVSFLSSVPVYAKNAMVDNAILEAEKKKEPASSLKKTNELVRLIDLLTAAMDTLGTQDLTMRQDQLRRRIKLYDSTDEEKPRQIELIERQIAEPIGIQNRTATDSLKTPKDFLDAVDAISKRSTELSKESVADSIGQIATRLTQSEIGIRDKKRLLRQSILVLEQKKNLLRAEGQRLIDTLSELVRIHRAQYIEGDVYSGIRDLKAAISSFVHAADSNFSRYHKVLGGILDTVKELETVIDQENIHPDDIAKIERVHGQIESAFAAENIKNAKVRILQAFQTASGYEDFNGTGMSLLVLMFQTNQMTQSAIQIVKREMPVNRIISRAMKADVEGIVGVYAWAVDEYLKEKADPDSPQFLDDESEILKAAAERDVKTYVGLLKVLSRLMGYQSGNRIAQIDAKIPEEPVKKPATEAEIIARLSKGESESALVHKRGRTNYVIGPEEKRKALQKLRTGGPSLVIINIYRQAWFITLVGSVTERMNKLMSAPSILSKAEFMGLAHDLQIVCSTFFNVPLADGLSAAYLEFEHALNRTHLLIRRIYEGHLRSLDVSQKANLSFFRPGYFSYEANKLGLIMARAIRAMHLCGSIATYMPDVFGRYLANASNR
jgi:hypothetical protein